MINKVEIASDAAETFVDSWAGLLGEEHSEYDAHNDIYIYTEKWQEVYNKAYDTLYDLISDE